MTPRKVTLTFPLPDAEAQALAKLASRRNVAPSDMLRAWIASNIDLVNVAIKPPRKKKQPEIHPDQLELDL